MAGAAYEVTASLTDDESFGFPLELKQQNGTSLPLADYAFEYELVGGAVALRLDEASGIAIDLANSLVTIDPGSDFRLPCGRYRHGFRLKHRSSGKTVQLFDGSVTVTEGNFS